MNATGRSQRAGKKTLIQDISGIVKEGEMVALMGLSGSGKTTMLNCLTRQIMAQVGEVRVGTDPRGAPATVGYMPDHGNFLEKATVQDTLLYKARLIMPERSSSNAQEEVAAVLAKLGLAGAQHTQVCSLSAGEVKRLSLAAQLLRKPDVLILDEPLSGLDSASSIQLAAFLKSLVSDEGIGVLLSLHQPRPEIYDMMDVVGIMHHGNIVYWGGREETLPFLEKHLASQLPSTAQVEPAHRVLDILSSYGCEDVKDAATTMEARFNESEEGKALSAIVRDSASSSMMDYRGPSPAKGWFIQRFKAGLVISGRHTLGALRMLAMISLALLALFTVVSPGFSRTAEVAPGLALVLWVVAFNTSSAVMAYNSTGFTRYLFVPYFDVLEGLQSLSAYMALVISASLFHLLPIFVIVSTMFITVGIDGPPWLFPIYAVGALLWAFGVFGYVALIMGLECLLYSVFTSRNFHPTETGLRHAQHPILHVLVGLYTIYSGVITTPDSIPAGLLWVYYTNPVTWFVKAVLTAFVCGASSCESSPLDLSSSVLATYIDGVVNLDKRLFASLSEDGDDGSTGVLGVAGGGGIELLANRAEDTLVDQLDLERGSVQNYLLISLAVSIAPFVVGYVFLMLHQLWLRQRVSQPRQANQDQEAPKPATSVGSGGLNSKIKGGMVLLAGVAAMALVVVKPAVLVGRVSSSAGAAYGNEFETEVAEICPGCINGFAPLDMLTASSPGLTSQLVRLPLVEQAAKAMLLTIPRKNYLFEPGNTAFANQSAFRPTEVRDFLDITARVGQNFSGDFVNLRNAEGIVLQASFAAGGNILNLVQTVPSEDDFPVGISTGVADRLSVEFNTTLDEALASRRLYRNRLLGAMDDLPGQTLSSAEGYVNMNVRTLLFRNDDGELETVAVQLGRGYPILVEDAMNEHCWSIAKAIARHSMVVQLVLEHVAALHFVGNGAFYISAEKNLSPDHPVRRFLEPHLHPMGPIDNFLITSGDIGSTGGLLPFRDIIPGNLLPIFGAIGEFYNWTENANLRNRLEAAGLDDLDDGLSLEIRTPMLVMHDAARVYAGGIVDMAYADDNAVTEDVELQEFVWDLCSKKGGNIQGLCWGGESNHGRRYSAHEEAPMPTKTRLVELLGDALSGVFLLHGFVHSRSLYGLFYVPLGPTNMRPNFIPSPESVCTEQDVVDAFGDHEDWASHMMFLAQVFSPVMGHVTLFRGHYSMGVGAEDPLSAEKNKLFDTFVDSIESSFRSFDAQTGLNTWEQLGAWIAA